MEPTPPGTGKPQRGGFFRALVKHRKAVEKGESFDGTIPVPTQAHPDSQDPRAPSWSLQQRARSSAALFLEKLTLKFLEKLWVAIKKNFMLSTNGKIDVHDFMKLSHQQMPEFTQEDDHYLEQLFDRVDRLQCGVVKTTDIATAMILICKEDPITKLRLLFRVFDADDDSCLTPDEIFDMYFSIKCNDICKDRASIQADITFDDELSLHEAKRLYERTVENMGTVSDFIIFEEFSRVFTKLPLLLKSLLPGAFSLEWILTDYRTKQTENGLVSEIKDSFVKALRRTDESLNLSMKRGRGLRIMQNCLDLPITWTGGETKASAGFSRSDGNHGAVQSSENVRPEARTRLPKLQSASEKGATKGAPKAKAKPEDSKKKGAKNQKPTGATPAAADKAAEAEKAAINMLREEEDDEEDSEDDGDEDDDEDGYPAKGASAQHAPADRRKGGAPMPRAPGGERAGKTAKYSIDEAMDIPHLSVQTLNHKNASLFRTMKWDQKSEQAYLRDKQDVNRTFKYQCLVCGINHDFQLSKSAEHQHT